MLWWVGSFSSLQQEVVALRRWQFILCAAFVLAAAVSVAATERDHVIVPEDYFSLVYSGNPAVSPDAGSVAWIQSGWSGPGAGRSAELWVTDLKSRTSRPPVSGSPLPAWRPCRTKSNKR